MTAAVTAAIEAARAGDLVTLSTLVDWPLSGTPRMARSVHGVSEAYRARAVASGLADLDAASGNLTLAGELLEPIAARLVEAGDVRPADAAARDRTLAALRIPETPAGLTEDQQARLAELRRRAAGLSEVYVAGAQPVVVAGDKLVLPLDQDGLT